jgi:hypothetical protein
VVGYRIAQRRRRPQLAEGERAGEDDVPQDDDQHDGRGQPTPRHGLARQGDDAIARPTEIRGEAGHPLRPRTTHVRDGASSGQSQELSIVHAIGT